MTWDDDYFPLAARDYSWCAHCPNEIEPGDAIVKRVGEERWSHVACAKAQDDLDEDPDPEFHLTARRFVRRVRRDHVRRRRAAVGIRTKRKQRVPV